MWTWTSWFGALSAEAKGEYKMRYPEPARWAGFYEFVETGKPNLALLKKSILLSFESERFYSASDVESVFPGAVFDRLVTLLIREAIIGRFNEIEIRDGEPECPVFYTRGDEKRARDPMPKRLLGPVKLCLARMCGIEDCRGTATFTTRFALPEATADDLCEFKVTVAFEAACMRLTILRSRES
jgi:hypothetical protein